MTLTYEPLIPAVAWLALALLALGLWAWRLFRRPRGCSRIAWASVALLQVGALAVVLIVLLNPVWLESIPPPAGKPRITVLIDDSLSMLTADEQQGASRFAAAAQAARNVAERLGSSFDVRLLRFADTVGPIQAGELANHRPEAEVTDLSVALLEAVSHDSPQGQAVLLLSDGAHTSGPAVDRVLEVARHARTAAAPVWVTTLGTAAVPADLELRVARSQELIFAGQSLPLTAELRQQGNLTDHCTVKLLSGKEVLAEREVKLNSGVTRVSFLVSPSGVGVHQYQFVATALPGEVTDANNSAAVQARVVDQPVRVLVLEGKPYWDNKFLLRTLMEDSSLDVDCVVRVSGERWLWRKLRLPDSKGQTTEDVQPATAGDPEPGAAPAALSRQETVEFVSEVSSLLQTPQQLKEFQVILLGRDAESYLSGQAIENLRDWVAREGGALICYRGAPVSSPDQQLARILPVRWGTGREAGGNESRFRVQLTERGDDMSWLRLGGGAELQKLPSLTVSSAANLVKPLAVVLGRADSGQETAPVLTYQPYGTGRVVVVEGSGMWRWAFLPPEFREHDSAYGTLWQSLLRWLATSGGLLPGENFALQLDRLTYTTGEPVSAVFLRRPELDQEEVPAVELLSPTGTVLKSVQPMPLGEEPGVYQVYLGEQATGSYEVRVTSSENNQPATKSLRFAVRPDLREQLNIAARPDLMARIAEISGGEVLAAGEADKLAVKFQEQLRRNRPDQVRRFPAWDRWWVLCTVLLLWITSWVLRRREGLI